MVRFMGIAVTAAILFLFVPVGLTAEGMEDEGLPKIVKWEDGRAYDQDGRMVSDAWGYDTVNGDGRYVRFDPSGNVVYRSNKMREDYGEEFTDTEAEGATLSIRAEVPAGWNGQITVRLASKTGEAITIGLTTENGYAYNTELTVGGYEVEAEANWEGDAYETETSSVEITLTKEKTSLCEVKVGNVKKTDEDKLKGEAESVVPEGEGADVLKTMKKEIEQKKETLKPKDGEYGVDGGTLESQNEYEEYGGRKDDAATFIGTTVFLLVLFAVGSVLSVRLKRNGRDGGKNG